MGDKLKKYPVKEEKITTLDKEAGLYTPPEKYNLNKTKGDSNGDDGTDHSRANEEDA